MTKPIEDIHPLTNIDNDLVELLNGFANVISETVNFGTHVLSWETTEATGSDENIPIVMLLRHIIELIDSISILVKSSSIDPCKIILRSCLETILQLEYMLEKNSKERALNFLVWHYHKELNLARKLTPTDPSYNQFASKIKTDKSILAGTQLPSVDKLSEHISNLEKILTLPIYASAEAEYQRILISGGKIKNWYQLFDNIKSFEQLANHLKRQGLYEILYRGWSGPTHGTDIIQSKLSVSDGGQAQIVQIRFFKDAQVITHYAVTLSLITYQLMTTNRLIQHKADYSNWYLTIRDVYLQLGSQQLIEIK